METQHMSPAQLAAVDRYRAALADDETFDTDVDRARHELLELGLSIEDVDEIEG